MAIQDILDQIKKEAEKEMKTLDAEANERIAKIEKEYSEKRSAKKVGMEKKVEENTYRIRRRAETLANMEVRNSLLKAKRELLETILEKSMMSLVQDSDYTQMVTSLMKKVAKTFESGTLIAPKGKEAETKQAIQNSGTSFTMSDKPSTIRGGFILLSGQVEVDSSFEAILRRELWENLEIELNKLLFN
ncbi:MAG: V-type ATP synthase subunit E [Candidatus Peregrinibacteria bacterium]|nr:V-type ATP synthase subunit E [Candidatus Peregrinibacteria bacterium]